MLYQQFVGDKGVMLLQRPTATLKDFTLNNKLQKALEVTLPIESDVELADPILMIVHLGQPPLMLPR